MYYIWGKKQAVIVEGRKILKQERGAILLRKGGAILGSLEMILCITFGARSKRGE